MWSKQLILLLIFIGDISGCNISDSSPFSGTIFIDRDIITFADPAAYLGISYNGQGM